MKEQELKDHYFEDVKVGDTVVSAKRRLSGSEFFDFARISRDYTPLHLDEMFAKKSRFGKRIAHGLLVISSAVGLLSTQSHFMNTVVAVTGIQIRFLEPVFVGDTIHAKHVVLKKESTRSKEHGAVEALVEIFNQKGKKVAQYSYQILLRKREP